MALTLSLNNSPNSTEAKPESTLGPLRALLESKGIDPSDEYLEEPTQEISKLCRLDQQ
jgi:hypothetical protein